VVRKLSAEVLGTGLLVCLAAGVATLSFGFGATGLSFAAGVVATALAFGLVLLILAYVVGPVSGCHINPASRTANAAVAGVVVGFALALVRLIGIRIVGGTVLSQVWLFIVAPLVGGVLAAGLHRRLHPEADETLASGDPAHGGRGLTLWSFWGQMGIEGNRTGKWNRRNFRPGDFRVG
jgi:glycerol uptake facilitator-like aquaporin